MKKNFLLIICSCFTLLLSAQQKTAVVQTGSVKVVAPVATKELKRQLESNFKRKKYKNVLAIADTLLKRNKKDENAFIKKAVSEIMLKMDKQAINDFKTWYKNKDTAATILSLIPYQFDFVSKKRNGDIYYKSAMSYAPKNGIPYLLYGAHLTDAQQTDQAVVYANKGYNLLNQKYKENFVSTYALVLHNADHKEEAYKLMEDEMTAGRTSPDNIESYFNFYVADKRYADGIAKATELIAQDSNVYFFAQRGELNIAAGNSERACEDATILKNRFDQNDYWLLKYQCPQVLADAVPSMQRTYIYAVTFGDQVYDFRVSNPKVDMQNGISFKYKLTGETGYNGTVTMSKEATEKAHAQMNHFDNEKLELTDKSSVWISSEVYNQLKNDGESIMDGDVYFGQGAVTFTNVTDEKNIDQLYFPVKVDDETKYIKCIKVLGKDGEEMWINDDPKNPIILKMKTDFAIELKEIL